jgi:hypothetical protein
MDEQRRNESANPVAQIQTLLDMEEIRQLYARFWDACDGNLVSGPTHLYDEIADFFTEDGVWSVAPFGTEGNRFGGVKAEGREAIRESFKAPHGAVPFAMHLGVLPILRVDGDHATGRWKLLALMTTSAPAAMWAGAVHDAEYRRTELGWKISRVVVTVAFNSPFEIGWARVRYAPLARHVKGSQIEE